MKKIIIAGGSGYLGRLLTDHFVSRNHQVVILSRHHRTDKKNVSYYKWDGKTSGYWSGQLNGADVLINLNGKSVDCRYNEKNKQLIYDSRINSTYILGKVISELANPPKLWINASSATIYRHALDREMDEETGEFGNGFSVDVCQKWERVFNKSSTPHTRKVILRLAIILGNSGGAFQPLKKLAKAGLGGKQGKGNQYFSWLHEQDFTRIIDYIIKNEGTEGVYNAAAPNPVTNSKIMREIRRACKIPFGLSMPEWMLKIGAAVIRTEPELILKSRRVVPRRLIDSGFTFHYEQIDHALADM